MKKSYLVWALCACILTGCGGAVKTEEHACESHESHDHEGDDHEGHDHGNEADACQSGEEAYTDEIIFKEEQAKEIGLQTQVIRPASFTDVIKTGGSILAAQGDEATVVATVSGIVTFGRSSLVDGTPVGKGQVMLSLASGNLPEGDVAVRAKYAYETARKEYERMQQLVADKIVSAKEFEQARLNYENVKAAYDAIAGKQTERGVSVLSPMNGYLKSLRVKEGDYVVVGQPLATISQNKRLVLRAEISEKYYKDLPAIQSANFRTPYDDQVYKLSELNGRMLSFGKASGDDSFYIPVTFEFDNKGILIPGSFVEVYLLTTSVQDVLSVPVSALIEEQGVYSVFIRLDEEGYRKQEVTLGANNGAEVRVLSGLKPGDTVVTRGAYQIKLASASNAIPAHTH